MMCKLIVEEVISKKLRVCHGTSPYVERNSYIEAVPTKLKTAK